MSVKVIINADDFGQSKSISDGIVEAFNQGLISSTTLMVNQQGSEYAINLAKANPNLAVGLHVVLTNGKPLTSAASLINDEGVMTRENQTRELVYEDVYTEIKAQLEKLINNGIDVTHLDTHHFSPDNPVIRDALIAVALEYDLPLRYDNDTYKPMIDTNGIITTELFCRDYFKDKAIAETVFYFITDHIDAESIEIMTHCGFIDEEAREITGYVTREREIEQLRRLKLRTDLYEKIELINYRDLKEYKKGLNR